MGGNGTFYDMGGWNGITLPPAKIAVDLFMMISGFLMTALAVMRNEKEPMTHKSSWYKFWLRRFFRIAPAYYLSLLIAVLLSTYFLEGYHLLQIMNPDRWANTIVYNPEKIEYTFKNILIHVTFLFGLHPQYSFSTFLPDWSLSLEMQFYFIFPFLFIVMGKFGVKKSVLVVGLFFVLFGFVVSKVIFFYEPSFLGFKLQYFIAGILLFYILSVSKLDSEKWLLYLLALFFVSVEFKLHYGTYRMLPAVLLSLMFLFGWLESHHKLPSLIYKLFHSRIINFMSDSSYSVYLFHGFFISLSAILIAHTPALNEASLLIHTGFMFVFVVIFTYPLAYFIFLFVEKPGIQYGKSLIEYWFSKKGDQND